MKTQPYAAISKLLGDAIDAVKRKQGDDIQYSVLLPLYEAWIHYDVSNEKYTHNIISCIYVVHSLSYLSF